MEIFRSSGGIAVDWQHYVTKLNNTMETIMIATYLELIVQYYVMKLWAIDLMEYHYEQW